MPNALASSVSVTEIQIENLFIIERFVWILSTTYDLIFWLNC